MAHRKRNKKDFATLFNDLELSFVWIPFGNEENQEESV